MALLFGVNQSQISMIHKNRDNIFEEWQSKQQQTESESRLGSLKTWKKRYCAGSHGIACAVIKFL